MEQRTTSASEAKKKRGWAMARHATGDAFENVGGKTRGMATKLTRVRRECVRTCVLKRPSKMVRDCLQAAAVAYYVLCGWLGMGFVINFVVCIILLSMDFWVVKNVTGRLLVGLRWWNEIKEDGTSEWQFESADMNERAIDKKESTWFWTWLFAAPAAWSFLAIIACVKFNFDYLLISIMAIMLGSANVMGYWKCSKDAKEKMSSMANDVMSSSVRAAVGRFFSRS